MLNFRTFARRFAWPLWPWYAGGLLFLAATNLITVEIPQLAKAITNSVGQTRPGEDLLDTAMIIIALGLAQFLTRSLSRILTFWPGRSLEAHSKTELFAHTIRLPRSFLDRFGTGDLISRLSNDLGNLRVFFAFGVLQLFNLLFLTAFTVTQMFATNPRLTLVCLCPLILMVVLTRFVMPRLQKYNRLGQEALGRLTNRVTEAFVNVHVIQANGSEEAFARGTEIEANEVYHTNVKIVAIRTVFFPLITMLTAISQVLILFYGGAEVLAGRLTVGDILAFNIYLTALAFPLTSIGMILAMYQRGKTALERLNVLDEAAEETARDDLDPGSAAGTTPPPLLEVRHLSFGYPGQTEHGAGTRPVTALKDISFTMREGQKTGLFGPVGSGKSTLFNLLTRIYDPPPGTIFWKGRDILTMEPGVLRREVSYALQSVHLFSDTIEENLRFGIEPPPPRPVLEQAAATAHILDEIHHFSQGWETEIGEKGIRLSGGQKQRLALARYFLRNPGLLLLDDVLSAVDQRTEKGLIDSIHSRGTATIIASHRASALQLCDEILMLRDGMLEDQGSWAELAVRHPVLREEQDGDL